MLAAFREGFDFLTAEACRAAEADSLRRVCVTGRMSSLGARTTEEGLQRAVDFASVEVPLWLHELDAIPPPTRIRGPLKVFVAEEIVGPDAPFAAAVGLAVYRELPQIADNTLLGRLVTDGARDALHFLAFEALLQDPDAISVEFLRNAIRDTDDRISRRSLAILAKRGEGPAEVRSFLESAGWSIPQGLALDVGRILTSTGLDDDPTVVANMLDSPSNPARLAVLEALSNREVGDVDSALIPRLAELATAPGEGWFQDQMRHNALAAIRGADVDGTMLADLASRDDIPIRDRIDALDLWHGSPERTARQALTLLPLASWTWEVRAIVELVAPVVDLRLDLEEALIGWLREHDAQRDELLTKLAMSRRSEVGEVASDMLNVD